MDTGTRTKAFEGSVLRPLSAAQLGIWIAQQFDPGSPAYNIGEYLEILGSLDLGLFEVALRRIVAETDALHIRIRDQ